MVLDEKIHSQGENWLWMNFNTFSRCWDVLLKSINVSLAVAPQKKSVDSQSDRFIIRALRIFNKNFYGNPSINGCWNISIWIKMANWLTDIECHLTHLIIHNGERGTNGDCSWNILENRKHKKNILTAWTPSALFQSSASRGIWMQFWNNLSQTQIVS